MRRAGPIVAVPFSMESFAFFIEAIFLALYTYGWRKLPPWFHFIWLHCRTFKLGLAALLLRSMVDEHPQGFELLVDGEWLLKVENFATSLHSLLRWNHAAESLPLGSHLKSILQIPSRPRYPGFLGSGLVLTRLDSCVDGFTEHASSFHPCTSNCSTCLHHQHFPSCDGRGGDFWPKTNHQTAAAEAHFETSSKAGLWIGGSNEETRTVDWESRSLRCSPL